METQSDGSLVLSGVFFVSFPGREASPHLRFPVFTSTFREEVKISNVEQSSGDDDNLGSKFLRKEDLME